MRTSYTFHYVFKNEGITVNTAEFTFIWGDLDGREGAVKEAARWL